MQKTRNLNIIKEKTAISSSLARLRLIFVLNGYFTNKTSFYFALVGISPLATKTEENVVMLMEF